MTKEWLRFHEDLGGESLHETCTCMCTSAYLYLQWNVICWNWNPRYVGVNKIIGCRLDITNRNCVFMKHALMSLICSSGIIYFQAWGVADLCIPLFHIIFFFVFLTFLCIFSYTSVHSVLCESRFSYSSDLTANIQFATTSKQPIIFTGTSENYLTSDEEVSCEISIHFS